jgi:hypothetical protein
MRPIPKLKDELSRKCISCGVTGLMEVAGIKKHGRNDDGSTCYALKAVCGSCGYVNGEFKPIWYNLYELGAVV